MEGKSKRKWQRIDGCLKILPFADSVIVSDFELRYSDFLNWAAQLRTALHPHR